jgi:hypothetical protein|tara:strand:+ start:66 stop:686 length:621 start_codon:yes stop_codon:yes gene_type:complete
MYKHKPGIQMDEYGFNESKNITGKKIEDLRHMIYSVLEPMIIDQEKKDKNLKLRLDGHGCSILENLEYPAKKLLIDYKHKKSNHIYEIQIKDVSVNYDEKGDSVGLRLMNLNDIMKKKFPDWVFFKNNSFYFFRKPKFKLGANYKLQCDYNFEYERCNTQDKFTDWVQHLNSKNWVHKQMLNQFMKLADKAHKEKTGDNLIGWGAM